MATLKNTTINDTGYIRLPSGTTAQRPDTPAVGDMRYNSTTGFAEVYTSGGWGIFGALPPSISSVSPVTFTGEQGTTFTINGANFTSDATVIFITNSNTQYTAATVTFVSTTQLLATTPRDFTVAEEPLDVRVSQASGIVTSLDVIDCGGSPTWTTAAGTLATINDRYGSYSPIASVTATDPDAGATLSYSIASGSIPAGTSLNASTGAISGDPTDVASQTTSNFDIAATDNAGNTSTRSFSIIVNVAKDGTTSARAATTAAAIKTLTGTTTNGKYWITINSVAREIYCDMANDGGGWMLYTSFSSINEYANSTNFPAIYGNGLTNSTLGTYGYSTNYTSYHDGTTDNLGYTYSGSTYQGPYSFYYSSGPNGIIAMDTWGGPSSGITQARVKYGGGASNYNPGGPGGYVTFNNNAVTLAQNDSLAGGVYVGNFNPSGATPYFRAIEVGIMGLWWIMVR